MSEEDEFKKAFNELHDREDREREEEDMKLETNLEDLLSELKTANDPVQQKKEDLYEQQILSKILSLYSFRLSLEGVLKSHCPGLDEGEWPQPK